MTLINRTMNRLNTYLVRFQGYKNDLPASAKERERLFTRWYRNFNDNPFQVRPENISRQTYLDLAAEARSRTYPDFMKEVEAIFGYPPPQEFIDQLALSTQIVVKKSRLIYLHGYLLYAALRQYLDNLPAEQSITIFETGTARGFSTLCMAKALDDSKRAGKIITVDVLPSNVPIYWNCIHDVEGKKTRFQLLEQWQKLVNDYIIFVQGYTETVLRQIGLNRIHMAFLDAEHTYESLKGELEFVAALQKTGDIIVCDDYNQTLFPGVVQVVDEFAASKRYSQKILMNAEGRGYVYFRRN